VLPARLLTSNPHLVLPLACVPDAARRPLESSVLPAWAAACAEAGIPFLRAEAAGGASEADCPVPAELLAACASRLCGPPKRYASVLPDAEVEALASRLAWD
jgi:hypothetical protein